MWEAGKQRQGWEARASRNDVSIIRPARFSCAWFPPGDWRAGAAIGNRLCPGALARWEPAINHAGARPCCYVDDKHVKPCSLGSWEPGARCQGIMIPFCYHDTARALALNLARAGKLGTWRGSGSAKFQRLARRMKASEAAATYIDARPYCNLKSPGAVPPCSLEIDRPERATMRFLARLCNHALKSFQALPALPGARLWAFWRGRSLSEAGKLGTISERCQEPLETFLARGRVG